MKIQLKVEIEGEPYGGRIEIVQANESPLDKAGDVLLAGSSWNDVEAMLRSKVLESQGRIEEAKAVRARH